MSTHEQNKLQEIINDGRKRFFTTGYRASNAETAGILMSQYFDWDGIQILEMAHAALEDANFHTEAGMVEAMLIKITNQQDE
jgi:hypothetical protein